MTENNITALYVDKTNTLWIATATEFINTIQKQVLKH
ncbi:MAG: hypothetical protein IPJ20_11645 [Flammeovirgaceae bacterium]|nr:hypothetical protein [Flammeovirgaceae bacterium]